MSVFKKGISFPLGETIPGLDSGRLVNTELEGQECELTHEDFVEGSGSALFAVTVRTPSRVRIMRNTSGAALLPGEIATVNVAGGAAGLGSASAKSSANSRNVVVVDPTLPAAGVADDDLFLAFVYGPAKIKFPSAGLALDGGDVLAAGATGRAALAVATAGTTRTIIATVLSGAQAANLNENALKECYLHPVCL